MQLSQQRAGCGGGRAAHSCGARRLAGARGNLVRPRVAAPEQASAATTTTSAPEQQDQQQQDQQQQRRPPAIAAPPPGSTPPVTSLQQLPRDLANATALLEAPNAAAPGGATRVFVLGASHVSQVSCDQVKQLIRAVRPQVVLVELCKERVGLLVDKEEEDRRLETWHCRRVTIEGVPEGDPLWPTPQQLQELLVTRLGAAVHTKDIEADCSRLLATGLFGRARPTASPALRGEAPQFGAVRPAQEEEDEEEEEQAAAGSSSDEAYSGEVGLQMVPPLGSLKFVVEPRLLPLISSMEVRLDSSLRDTPGGVTAEQLQQVVNALLEGSGSSSKKEGGDATTAEAAKQGEEGGSGKEEDKDKEKDEEKDKEKDKEDAKAGDSSLLLYLRARAALAAQFPDPTSVVVDFAGVEGGRVEALVRARRPADPAFVSGLEGSAPGGEGLGIDSFRPQRSSVQLSPGMLLPAEAAERLAAVRAARQAGRLLGAPQGWAVRTSYRLWQQDEVTEDAGSPLPPNPVADTFARLMTGLYARLQSAAGEQVGITPGAAWRAAMEAATEVGSQQVILGDRPSDVSQRRMATNITAASGGRLLAALGVLAAGVAASAGHVLPPDVEAAAAALTGSGAAAGAGLAGASAAASLALAWPVLAPFAEAWRFSRLDGEELEEVVAVKEPLQANLDRPFYVWGEDALLSWPGAEGALIGERDAFMARVLAAAATGATCNAPAFVAEEDESGQLMWRYLMPEGATAASAPRGAGDGAFEPLAGPECVVAVVGSAHVRGMCKEWAASLAAAGQVEQLLKVE